jgi:hypothetical protein
MPRPTFFNETPCRFILWVSRERGLRWQQAAREAGFKDVRGWIIQAADSQARRQKLPKQ